MGSTSRGMPNGLPAGHSAAQQFISHVPSPVNQRSAVAHPEGCTPCCDSSPSTISTVPSATATIGSSSQAIHTEM